MIILFSQLLGGVDKRAKLWYNFFYKNWATTVPKIGRINQSQKPFWEQKVQKTYGIRWNKTNV